jgi:hypothetical protein
MKGAKAGEKVFGQRHEADTIELFFDLFFVANLATFTAYHSILDLGSLAAYIGFFGASFPKLQIPTQEAADTDYCPQPSSGVHGFRSPYTMFDSLWILYTSESAKSFRCASL